MGLTCPNCKKVLVTKKINIVEIDYCENGCKGVWFDEGELKKIRELAPQDETFAEIKGICQIKSKEEESEKQTKICPHCNIELFRYNWNLCSQIYLDSCSKCNGIWFDLGEVSCIEQYLKEHSFDKPINEEELKLKLKEIKENTTKKFDQDKEENINKIIDWDIWVFDDILKFLVKKLT